MKKTQRARTPLQSLDPKPPKLSAWALQGLAGVLSSNTRLLTWDSSPYPSLLRRSESEFGSWSIPALAASSEVSPPWGVGRDFETTVDPQYMSRQQDLMPSMRSVTWDWLVRVHWKFNLQQQTLFLTANYLDRYLSKVQVSRHKLQLVGVTAMFIACKYEEVVVPESADFVYMTDKAYSKAELIEMEREMLSQLNYKLAVITQLDILKDLAQEAKASPYVVLLASYILELLLLTLDYLNYAPAQQAAAALFLSLRILNRDMSWNVKSFSSSELRPLAKQFLCCYRDAGLNELRASFSKFAQPKHMSVSTIKII